MNRLRRVWVVSDGKPGHYNQSRGVVLALQRLGPVEQSWINVRLRSGLWRVPLTLLLNLVPGALRVFPLAWACEHDPLPVARPDVIVVAGGRAVFAAILLARSTGAALVYCGSLRRLAPRHFTAVLTLERQADHPANVVVEFPPMPVDRDDAARRGAELRARLSAGATPLWAVLVGGDGAGFSYDDADWRALARGMSERARAVGARLLVTTSRRTGADADALLRAEFDPAVLADAVWYSVAPRAVLAEYLGAASRVYCTADSMSMLMESIVAGRPVYAMRPRACRPDARYRAVLGRLAAEHRVVRVDIDRLAQPPGEEDFRCLPADPLDTLASLLASRLERS